MNGFKTNSVGIAHRKNENGKTITVYDNGVVTVTTSNDEIVKEGK